MLVFAINLIGAALMMRSPAGVSAGGPQWFTRMLVATAAVALVQSAALLATIGFGLIPFLIPSVMWVITLLRLAWMLDRRAATFATA